MKDLDARAFISLFEEACEKCFGHRLVSALSEPESKQLSNQVLEKTGLVIGPKSLKNYSVYVLNAEAKSENPSISTLDTLARYVLAAPYTDEIKRKENENHFPYWFEYRDRFARSSKNKTSAPDYPDLRKLSRYLAWTALLTAAAFYFLFSKNDTSRSINENFKSVNADTLSNHGWIVLSTDNAYWSKRSETPGYLTLFTLKGDNWPDSSQPPRIKNLLIQEVNSECFTAEVHFNDFIPQQNWQQAGLILLEDTTYNGKSIRLSLAYNDFFGGYSRPKEILIQAITSKGKEDQRPEEIAHQPLFLLGDEKENETIFQNLKNTALRIEKQGNKIRLLSSNGSLENPAFREVVSKEITIKPKYVGIFALKGFVDNAREVPVHIKLFRLTINPCSD
jgi:hypothetical protein